MSIAYQEGYQSYINGGSNPYKVGSVEWMDWEDGYRDALDDDYEYEDDYDDFDDWDDDFWDDEDPSDYEGYYS